MAKNICSLVLFVVVFVGVYCKDIPVEENEGSPISKNSENTVDVLNDETEFNAKLLSEINDPETPENPLSVKEKRCPKYRLGSSLVGSSLNSNQDSDTKSHKLYDAFCKTCLLRNKCNLISECPLCEKWCMSSSSTSKVCKETDENGKETVKPDEQTKDETVSLANRGSFDSDIGEVKDNIYTIKLMRRNLVEIILSLLGVYDTKDVESLTVTVKIKGDKPAALENLKQNLVDDIKEEELAGKLRDLCSISKKMEMDGNQNVNHEKLQELITELLKKLRGEDIGSPTVGSPSDVPNIGERFKEEVHQSVMNPDIIEDSLDTSRVPNRLTSSNNDVLGSPTKAENKNDIIVQPGYEPLNSKDSFNSESVRESSTSNDAKINDAPDKSNSMPSLGVWKDSNIEPRPQDVMNRMRSQFQTQNFDEQLGDPHHKKHKIHPHKIPHHDTHFHHPHHPIHSHHSHHPHHFRTNDVDAPRFAYQPYDGFVEQPGNVMMNRNNEFVSQPYDSRFIGEANPYMRNNPFDYGYGGYQPSGGDNQYYGGKPTLPNDVIRGHGQRIAPPRFGEENVPNTGFENLGSVPYYQDSIRDHANQFGLIGQPLNNKGSLISYPQNNQPFANLGNQENIIGQPINNNQEVVKINIPDVSRDKYPQLPVKEKEQELKKDTPEKIIMSGPRIAEESAEETGFMEPKIGAAHGSESSSFKVSIPKDKSLNSNINEEEVGMSNVEEKQKSMKNSLDEKTREVMQRLKERKEETLRKLENKKQLLGKSRFGTTESETQDKEKLGNSKLTSFIEKLPKKLEEAASDSLHNAESSVDKLKDLVDPKKQFKDFTKFADKFKDDFLGSQPVENSIERMHLNNLQNKRLKPLNSGKNFDKEILGEPLPDVNSRGNFEEPSTQHSSLGKLIPGENETDISLKKEKPSEVYFIGNGIKLPLRMVKNNDGAVHLQVDIEKLCSCNNATCPKNQTAKQLEQTVEEILEKEAELKNQLEDLGDIPLGMPAPKELATNGENNFASVKNRIASRFSSLEQSKYGSISKRSLEENLSDDESDYSESESFEENQSNYKKKSGKLLTDIIGKGFKEVKKAISSIPEDAQIITTRLLMPETNSNIMQPTRNMFKSNIFKGNDENIIPIYKMYKFKGLQEKLAKNMENIEKTVDNYSKIDDKIFKDESEVLNKFNDDPIIQKEIGLVSDVLGFLKKLAVDTAKHKDM